METNFECWPRVCLEMADASGATSRQDTLGDNLGCGVGVGGGGTM